MSSAAPPSGTTRYLCPLECGWHHDRAPLPDPTGVSADPGAWTAEEAFESWTRNVMARDMQQTEQALREHLDTHTTEQFVRTIQGLRAEVAALRERPVGSEEKNA
jgi:hypothetical protein